VARHANRGFLPAMITCLVVASMTAARADVLRLVAADSVPTAYLVDGKPAGILVDLVTEAFHRTGHEVDISLRPWARCLEDAKTGVVDGVFSSFQLPEREKFLAFTKEVLVTQDISLFVQRDSTLKFDGDLEKLRDVRIGIIRGTSYGKKFDAALDSGVLKNVEVTVSVDSNIRKLALKRIDVLPSYRFVALDAAKKFDLQDEIRELSPTLESIPSYLAFTKVRSLAKQSDDFDIGIASMKKDGSYDRIIGKYIPVQKPTPR
jgi:polar amino acid transport system substrate-binding protein